MVTVTNYVIRTNSEGKLFTTLVLQGDLEMVQSLETGRYYATARTCSISSTFDENTASLMIGKQITGNIIKESCDPYEYAIPETGEQITLTYRYVFNPEEKIAISTKQNTVVKQPLQILNSSGNHFMAEA